jgi:hypothetical protein
VKIWDVEQKTCLRKLWEHTDRVATVCSHPTNDGNITLYMFFNNEFSSTAKLYTSHQHSLYLQILRYNSLWFKRWILSSLGLKMQVSCRLLFSNACNEYLLYLFIINFKLTYWLIRSSYIIVLLL